MKEATIKIMDKRIPLSDDEMKMDVMPKGGHIHLVLALPENVKDALELLEDNEHTLFKGLMIGWDLKIRSAVRGAFADLDGTETRISIQESVQANFNDYIPCFERVSKAKTPTLASARKQATSVLDSQFGGDKEAFKVWLAANGII